LSKVIDARRYRSETTRRGKTSLAGMPSPNLPICSNGTVNKTKTACPEREGEEPEGGGDQVLLVGFRSLQKTGKKGGEKREITLSGIIGEFHRTGVK